MRGKPCSLRIGKHAIVNHHRGSLYRLLHCDSKLSAGKLNGLPKIGHSSNTGHQYEIRRDIDIIVDALAK